METRNAIAAARAFTRNLNILLKTARLYGVEHERTEILLQAAWSELQSALKSVGGSGLLLGVSGSQVLLDGVPLESRPTDRSFAQLLSSAGLASLHFSPRVTRDDFARLVHVFATRQSKAGPLAAELKAALPQDGQPAIRINEVRFIAHDASLVDAGLAAQVAIRSLGQEAENFQALLNDPKKLLQLIAAAEGTRGAPSAPQASPGGPGGPRDPTGSTGSSSDSPGAPGLEEDDLLSIIGILADLGQAGRSPDSRAEAAQFHQQLDHLPASAHLTITEALAALAATSSVPRPDTPLLVQLAENIAIRFALERYERGDVSVNSVVQLLDRMKREIKALRQILQKHEEKMGRAGLDVEAHTDILDREFWAALPEFAKLKILNSSEAWAIPPSNIRQFASELLDHDEVESAVGVLQNYAQCVHAAEPEARRKVVLGLTDLADVYVRAEGSLLRSVIQHLGEQLKQEGAADLQPLLSASFVRFSHEAAAKHNYQAVEQALASLDTVGKLQPGLAELLGPRIRVGHRLNEFIEEAVTAPQLSEDLVAVLRRMPDAAVEQAASRLVRCSLREECDRLVAMVRELGPAGVASLRRTLAEEAPEQAVSVVALLARLDPPALEELLPGRLREWSPQHQDHAVRQLALSGAPERGQFLAQWLEALDSLVLPEALDEIGMSGDQAAGVRLLSLVEEEIEKDGEAFLRIKAIEGLGRLRAANGESVLRTLVETRKFLGWRYPRELRITAAQALRKIDPEWARGFLPRSGLSRAELAIEPLDPEPSTPWARQRRYERVELVRSLAGSASLASPASPSGGDDYPMDIMRLSMGGGVAACQRYLKPGALTQVQFRCGLRRVQAQAMVREVGPQQLAFELVKIGFWDRHRLRRPLAQGRG